MEPGARTPEELETLLEDAFVTRDAAALQAMFADGAVLVAGSPEREARGAAAIGRYATALWAHDGTYVAAPLRVVQARDTALVLGRQSINVARRGADGGWRYAIALLPVPDTIPKEEHR
jgi:ketosteroid isomerase-like protein